MSSSSEQTRRLVVLGSGADVDYGIPTMNSLMHELAAFSRRDGMSIDKALRGKLPHLRFTFDKFAGDQSDALVTRLFGGEEDIAVPLVSAATKLSADPEMKPVQELIEQLTNMAKNNLLSGKSLQGIAHLAGEKGDVGGAEPLLDPKKVSMSPIPSSALRRSFQQALLRGPSLSAEERDTLELLVVATSNIEQLLSIYFLRFHSGGAADRKNYLYLAWMLWAFLRYKSAKLGPRAGSVYSQLPRLGADVVTFNYTNFFERSMLGRVRFFHGRLDHYLKVDTRELVTNDPRLSAANDADRIASFLDGLRLDVRDGQSIDIPAIVPPTTFKPVMSREQLRVWVETDDLVQSARLILIVGYSFGLADEHFNDLLRKADARTRILLVNPDLKACSEAIGRVLTIPREAFSEGSLASFDTLSSGRITCVRASASDVGPQLVEAAAG